MTSTPVLTDRDVQLIEQAEAEYFRRFLARTPDAARATMGIDTTRIGDGIGALMVHDPSGYWTKALGFGFDVPVDDALVTEATSFFRAAGKRAGTLAIAPSVLPEDWERIRADLGLVAGSVWSKFACRVDEFVPGATDLEIRRLGPDDVQAWVRITREAMGMPEPDMTPVLAAALEDPVAQVFGAWDGDLLVGAGAVYLLGEAASFNTGGTLASHRNRGVQSGLLAARAAAAAAAGCRLFTSETGRADGNPSYRNLVRSGFTHQYDRTNWRWTA
jgi:hypothetical protein